MNNVHYIQRSRYNVRTQFNFVFREQIWFMKYNVQHMKIHLRQNQRASKTRKKGLKLVLTQQIYAIDPARLMLTMYHHKLLTTIVTSLTLDQQLLISHSLLWLKCMQFAHACPTMSCPHLVNSPYLQPTNLLARPHRCKQSSPSLIMGVALPGDHQLHLRCTLPAWANKQLIRYSIIRDHVTLWHVAMIRGETACRQYLSSPLPQLNWLNS